MWALNLASACERYSLTKKMMMMIEHLTPIKYYWLAAVAFFGATILAASIRLRHDRAVMRLER